jgi:hypothetical protein
MLRDDQPQRVLALQRRFPLQCPRIHAYSEKRFYRRLGGVAIRPPYPPRAARLLIVVACLPALLAAGPADARAENTPPSCAESSPQGRVDNDTTRGVSFQCYDADGDALTYSLVAGPQHGSLSAITTNNYGGPTTYTSAVYTPAAHYVGQDSFTYRASDGSVDSNIGEFSFTVTDPSPPTCTEPPAVTMRPTAKQSFALSMGCNGSPGKWGEMLTFRITRQPAHGTLESNDDAGSGAYPEFSPDQSYSGPDSFKYVAVGSGGDSDEVTQQITLDPAYNRKPTCSGTGPPSLRVGNKVTLQLACSDWDGDPITIAVDTSGMRGDLSAPSDEPPSDGLFFPFPGAKYVTYTAPADAGNGHDQFSYTATDDRGATADQPAVQKFDIHPADYNTAPHCDGFNPYGNQVESGSTAWIGPQCTDDEKDPMTYAVVAQPSHGTVVVRTQKNSDGTAYYNFDYKPAGDYLGEDSFSYRATDDRGASSAEKAVTVKVIKPQPPSCSTPPLDKIRSGREHGLLLYCFGGIFGGGVATSYSITTQPQHGTVTFPDGDGKNWVVYHPDAGYEGSDSFSYRGSNAAGDSIIVTQELSMSATFNRKPWCGGTIGFSQKVRAGSSRDLPLYCSDADGDPLTFKTAAPAHGTLGEVQQSTDPHGFGIASVRYTPAAGYLGDDSFTITANDGIADAEPVKIVLKVVDPATNSKPLCWSGTSVKVAANASYSFGDADFPCWDPDSDPFTQHITTPPQHGTLSAPDSHGARTYTPTDPNWTGEDSFGFEADDGRSLSGEATIRIDVTERVAVTAEPLNLPSGEPVRIENYVDGGGKSLIAVPSGDVRQFPSACMPLDVDTTIASGSGSVDNAKLVLAPADGGASREFAMTRGSGDSWAAQIDCVEGGELSVKWDFTEGGSTTALSRPLGGIVLIDPQGVVYDKDRYDAAVASGKSPDDARSAAAIEGATVELQRFSGGAWAKVVSGDPGISPNVNPQITRADGVFRWDVSAGKYRVVVTRPGYESVTSAAVDIPPPVTNLRVAMTALVPSPGDGGGDSGDGGGGSTTTPDPAPTSKPADDTPAGPGPGPSSGDGPAQTVPNPPATAKPACSGLKGKKKAECESKQRLKKALAKCSKLKGKGRATCIKRAKARAKCDRLAGRKKTACVRRANAIGRQKLQQ